MWLYELAPKIHEPDIYRLHQEINSVWQTYLRGQLLIMFLLGIMSWIGAALIGIPSALILGFLAGALAIIPGLGPAAATVVAALVAWTQGSFYLGLSNFTIAIIIVIIFQGIQFIEGFWLTPHIMNRRLHLHPGLVLIATVGTLFTLGALMTLIIVPLMVSLSLVIRYIWRMRIGLEPWLIEESPL